MLLDMINKFFVLACPSGQFSCAINKLVYPDAVGTYGCVKDEYKCDNEPDCADSSDEVGCTPREYSGTCHLRPPYGSEQSGLKCEVQI